MGWPEGNVKGGVSAEKNLLSLNQTLGEYCDFVAVFEIVIWNRTKYDLCDVRICDSLMGMKERGCDRNDGNECEAGIPYYTEVKAFCCELGLVPLSYQEIKKKRGQLVDPCRSVIRKMSIGRIMVTIVGGGLMSCENWENGNGSTSFFQNTATIRGRLRKECGKEAIFPIYVKSGVVKVIKEFNTCVEVRGEHPRRETMPATTADTEKATKEITEEATGA